MKKTLAIAFNGGTYGTYLGWILNILIDNKEIIAPFTSVGNSHGSILEKHLLNIAGVLTYFKENNEFPTVRFHPKTSRDESLKNNLELALTGFEKMILVYPDRDHEILCVNNFLTKIWTTNIYQDALAQVNIDDIYNNFPVDRSTGLANIPRWITREHLSYCLFNSWRDQVEWYFPDLWKHPRCLTITVGELLFDFERVLEKIFNFWGETPKREFKDILPWHTQMLSLQQNLGQDRLCKDIVNSITHSGTNISWKTLPLGSEAWIQQTLREHRIELQCHGLNTFPQDTVSLEKLCNFI